MAKKLDKKFLIIGSAVLVILIAVGAYFFLHDSDNSGIDFSQAEDPASRAAGVGSDIGSASQSNPYENTNPFDYKNPFD